jgi:hypothetical protein
MFHGYHDARRPLLHPCNKKEKTPASSGYKSQRMYCTGVGEERERRRRENRRKERDRKGEKGEGNETKGKEESVKKREAEGVSRKRESREKAKPTEEPSDRQKTRHRQRS